MEITDIYYRALTDYRKSTKENRDCAKQRKAIAAANTDCDKIEIVRTNCIIDDDWIVAIENGLVHIEKAINEERQFIRSNGEVVPIEKVKNVSKDSVEHLARHSNLLTKVTEGEDIIPDQLYTVERLADYAVYENRFLYMLLCYLRDFIAFRYEKIIELTNTYDGSLTVSKQINSDGRKTVYELNFKEEIKNDPYLKAHNPAKQQIDRIDLIYKTVLAFLKTPLMEFVAKAPVLKPPITETNVLRMNKNFKGAKELYYFVSSYMKAGYEVEREVHGISPFNEELADEFAEAVALNSFLTYEHGLGIEKELKAAYEEQERLNKEAEIKKRLEQLENLRKRLNKSGESAEEYILLLEQRNRALENESAQLGFARAEIDKLNGEIERLTQNVERLTETIEEKVAEIERMTADHAAEIQQINSDHAAEIERLNEEHSEEIDRVNRDHAEAIQSLNAAHAEEITGINTAHAEAINSLNARHEEAVQQLTAKAEEEKNKLKERALQFERERDEKIVENSGLNKKLEQADNDKMLLAARINALKHEQGLFTAEDNFTSQENFDEIERQYLAFKKFFKSEWKSAKKQIRSEMLGREQIKLQSQKRTKKQIKEDKEINGKDPEEENTDK